MVILIIQASVHEYLVVLLQDLCFKLVVLSWEDWSPEVRQAAAIALGLTGHAKVVRHLHGYNATAQYDSS